jgi:hypothetical protein
MPMALNCKYWFMKLDMLLRHSEARSLLDLERITILQNGALPSRALRPENSPSSGFPSYKINIVYHAKLAKEL